MITLNNSGLFYRFLTLLPSQSEPHSVCDLFWRLVLNTLVILGSLAGLAFYLFGVYGWFTGAFQSGNKALVIISAFSMAISIMVATWYYVKWDEHRKDKKRLAWQKETGGDYWAYLDYVNENRQARKAKLRPFLRKIAYGLEVFADLVGGLYKRVHDKTCVMVEFKNKNEPEPTAETTVDPFFIDVEDDEPDPVDIRTRVI